MIDFIRSHVPRWLGLTVLGLVGTIIIIWWIRP